MTKYFLFLVVLLVASCNNKNQPEKMANDTCDCLKQEVFGLSGIMSGNLDDGNELPECAGKIAKRLKKILDKKQQAERAEFAKEFLKALLDTQCGTMALKMAPYDELLNQYTPE